MEADCRAINAAHSDAEMKFSTRSSGGSGWIAVMLGAKQLVGSICMPQVFRAVWKREFCGRCMDREGCRGRLGICGGCGFVGSGMGGRKAWRGEGCMVEVACGIWYTWVCAEDVSECYCYRSGSPRWEIGFKC